MRTFGTLLDPHSRFQTGNIGNAGSSGCLSGINGGARTGNIGKVPRLDPRAFAELASVTRNRRAVRTGRCHELLPAEGRGVLGTAPRPTKDAFPIQAGAEP